MEEVDRKNPGAEEAEGDKNIAVVEAKEGNGNSDSDSFDCNFDHNVVVVVVVVVGEASDFVVEQEGLVLEGIVYKTPFFSFSNSFDHSIKNRDNSIRTQNVSEKKKKLDLNSGFYFPPKVFL